MIVVGIPVVQIVSVFVIIFQWFAVDHVGG